MAWHAAVYANTAGGFFRFAAVPHFPPAGISSLTATPATTPANSYLSRVHIQRMLLSQ